MRGLQRGCYDAPVKVRFALKFVARTGVVLVMAIAPACVEDDTPRGLEDRPPREDVFFEEPVSVFPRDVGDDAPTLAGTASCTPLEAGEELVALSPSGEAWLAAPTTGGVALRLALPGTDPVPLGRLAVNPPLTSGRAWEDGVVAFVAEERLFRFDGALLEPIRYPEGLPPPSAFCGDPGVDGGDTFVAAGDRLLQRSDGQWFEWALPTAAPFPSYGSLARFAAPEGACTSQDDVLYVRNAEGRVWFVARWRTEPIDDLEGATALVHDPAYGLAAIVDDELVTGGTVLVPELTSTRFSEGAPDALASADRTLFVRIGSTLYRGRDGEIARVTGATVAGELHAYAGGVVTVEGTSLCHLQVGPRLTLEGMRPFERRLAGTFRLAVTSDGLGAPEVTVDDVALPLTPAALGFESEATDVGARGWHRIRVVSGADDRTLRYFVRPPAATWESEVRELAATHCASSGACHAAERTDLDRPDLSTWETWVTNAEIIRTRLVETGDMPPAESRQPTWGPGVLTTILRWMDGGLPEGGEE